MRLLLSFGVATGLVLFWSGLQIGTPWSRRLDPYVSGYGNRPGHPDARGRTPVSRLAGILPRPGASVRSRLLAAGRPVSVEGFRYEQALWTVIGAAGGALLVGWSVATEGTLLLGLAPIAVLVGGSVGYTLRDVRLTRLVAERRRRVAADLPLACDLLTLAIMAGEAIPAAFERVARVLPGDVGDAFHERVADIRAGATTSEALQRLPEVLPGTAVARLTDSLCVGIERGTPLADTLRAQCDDLRDARRRELVESGGRREILMLVPVVFLILPVVVTFALYPGLVALELLVT